VSQGRRDGDGGGETEERDGGLSDRGEREREETGTKRRRRERQKTQRRRAETERRQEKEGFEWILGAMPCLFVSIFGGVLMFCKFCLAVDL
jgi:hypothetical protein